MIYRNSEKHNKHSHKKTTGKSGKKAAIATIQWLWLLTISENKRTSFYLGS